MRAGGGRKALAKATKALVAEETNSGLLDHWQSLEWKGYMSRCMDQECAHVWATVVKALQEEQMNFSLNAALNVLPHNSNLHLWKKKKSPACTLCGGNQTLVHMLNNCTTARYLDDTTLATTLSCKILHLPLSHTNQQRHPCQWTLVRDTSSHAALCLLTCDLTSCGGISATSLCALQN